MPSCARAPGVADVVVGRVLDLADPLAAGLAWRPVGREIVPAAWRGAGKHRAGDSVLAAAAQRGSEARSADVALLDDRAVRVSAAPPGQIRRVLPQAGHAEAVHLVERVRKQVLRVTGGEMEPGRSWRVETVGRSSCLSDSSGRP